jgi:recombinational DNA repair protein (RecF pathway)
MGEANVLTYILARNLGLILASAQGVRQPSSKLSSALTEYERLTLSCIKGKNGWKITDARGVENMYFALPQYTRELLARVGSLLIRMIPGEEPHAEVFDIVSSGFHFLKELEKKDVALFECLIVLRILYHLGYVVRDAVTEPFLASNEWNQSLLDALAEKRLELVKIINKGLTESNLT